MDEKERKKGQRPKKQQKPPLFPVDTEQEGNKGLHFGPLIGDTDDSAPIFGQPLSRNTGQHRAREGGSTSQHAARPQRAGELESRSQHTTGQHRTGEAGSRPQRATGQHHAPAAPARNTARPPARTGLLDRRLSDQEEEDLYYAETLHARPWQGSSSAGWSFGDMLGPASPGLLRHPLFLIVLAILSLLTIRLMSPANGTEYSAWGNVVEGAADLLGLSSPAEQPNPPGDYRLRGPPSLTATQIDNILASYGSPATGSGQAWVDMGRKYNIDPAFAVAFFIHESTAGTNPGWAGIKSDGTTTHNVGNIICAGYPTCYGRFRDYGSWEEGIEDWYRLIDVEYIKGRGTQTVAEIIPIYAPAFENNVQLYVTTVEQLVDSWRMSAIGVPGNDAPAGNPLNAANAVMTQGYGTGSHAPAATWGAIDLALDSNGDGIADPNGTWERPIYSTHSGIVQITPNSYPAGNHVWVINDSYKTGYAHLQGFAVENGQAVARGTIIGYIGSTGMSSGPHLDYQVWRKQGGGWVNVNPLDYGALDPLQ
jgi:murein DD-endopeptidase MepM/ murein hydrolase activator NlpD